MKSLKILLAVFIVFICSSVFAGTAAVLPLAATEDDHLAAEDIDLSIEEVLDDVKGADVSTLADSLGAKAKKELAKCGDSLDCQKKFLKKLKAKRKSDFYILSKMKFVKKSGKTKIETFLIDAKGNGLEKEAVNFDKGASTEKIASKLAKVWSKMLSSHSTAKDEPEEEEEEEEEPVRPAKKSSGKNVDSAIKEALEAYASGDLKAADKALYDAATKDVQAKELKANIAEISKFIQRANAAIKAKNYDEAIPVIAKAEKLDEAILEMGSSSKYRVYKKEQVERVIYSDPSEKDIRTVDTIHSKFEKQREKLRKERAASITATETWLNTRILEREAKVKQYDEDSAAAEKQKKTERAELTKRINDMKYQWQKDDSEIEQKIVELENKLTLYEQREKGVTKGSNALSVQYEKDMQKEMTDTDKKYGDILKKMRAEKEDRYKKQADELEAGNKKTEATVLGLETKKKANEEKISELDKKMTAEQEQFDENEKKIMSKNEEIKMKNEDEDRKYKVEVEKEYQAKFDDLNKKLQDYDAQESEEREKLKKYDAATEEYMFKNAEVMQKYQEEIEKERSAAEAECAKNKESASADAEKAYTEELEKLNKEKADIEAKIAEKETPALKKQLDAANKKISKHESGKDGFISKKMAAVEQACENKSMEIDMKLAKKSDELNKDNTKYQKNQQAEKKKAEANFKAFEQRKAAFKKNIDSQITQAQKDRDRKIEAREKERSKLTDSWNAEAAKRQKDLENKQRSDKNTKDRLVKDNEGIDAQIAIVNAKWADKSDDIKVKHQESNQKYEKTWQEKYDKTDAEYKAKKEEIENKYAAKQVADKDAQKHQKEKWEEEVQKLNEEKQRRKEQRQAILADEQAKWKEKNEKWDAEEAQRKEEKAEFSKNLKQLALDDKKEAASRKKEADQKYEEGTKAIDDKELEQIRAKFKEDYKVAKSREVVDVKGSETISKMKAQAFAQSGLKKLDERDLIGARRAFAEALRIDRNNKIALDGMNSINVTAKSMYWEAYGKRETDKAKAKEIFTLLIKTLMPSNEFFIKAKAALEDLQ